jgi:hypothetical protein
MYRLTIATIALLSGTLMTSIEAKETVNVPIDCYKTEHILAQYVEAKTWEPMVVLTNDKMQVVLMRDKTDNDVHVWLYLGETMCFVERGTLAVPAQGQRSANKGMM